MRSWWTIASLRRRALFTTSVAVLLCTGPRLAAAQQGTIGGTVVATGTQEPVASAQVVVVGTSLRAVTDARGVFRISGVTGSTSTIEVRRIGYTPARIQARVGADDNRVVLSPSATSLEAVVVTGQPGAAQKRELGNAIGTINAAEVASTAPVMSMQGLLNGRTAGVVILPTSGQVGSGSQVRIRGQASLSLGNNPLLYVDGVRVNNAAATGPVSQAFGSQPISRLNDFNPEDIESIEVLKGPSAATLYGTEAANGVINIITKKGASGVPRWNFTA